MAIAFLLFDEVSQDDHFLTIVVGMLMTMWKKVMVIINEIDSKNIKTGVKRNIQYMRVSMIMVLKICEDFSIFF